MTENFPGYCNWFAKNFHVLFVPFPVSDPIGQVQSGLISLSRINVESSTRFSLPGEYGWPIKLFHLKRCMNVLRIPGEENGKDWYVINLHLSAYDTGGTLRAKQLNFIKAYITELYRVGHYVIVGGDWNSLFPGVDKTTFGPYTTEEKDLYWVQKIPASWTPPEWQWAFDPATPTCRSLEAPYEKGKNFTTIIDGFLVSPNLEIQEVKGFDLGFRHSDHNPVRLQVIIKGK
ncbi:MAG: hypothetical protein JXJ04_25380 [Spirochaetales bacterium]|nr:hypothetical protein [Spirochaetales bacterium]